MAWHRVSIRNGVLVVVGVAVALTLAASTFDPEVDTAAFEPHEASAPSRESHRAESRLASTVATSSESSDARRVEVDPGDATANATGRIAEVGSATPDTFTIRGIVVDEVSGGPIPDAEVRRMELSHMHVAAVTVADAAGRFEFRDVELVRGADMLTSAPRRLPHRMSVAWRVPVPVDRVVEIVVRMPAGTSFVARAIDIATGLPIPDVVIRVGSMVVGKTAGNGELPLSGLDREGIVITAAHEAYLATERAIRRKDIEDLDVADRVLDLPLRAAVTLRGRVHDPSGRPLAGIGVYLGASGGFEDGTSNAAIVMPPGTTIRARYEPSTTDAAGRYELRDIAPSPRPYVLCARSDVANLDSGRRVKELVLREPGIVEVDVVLEPDDRGTLFGHVSIDGADGVAAIVVEGLTDRRETTTDTLGRFEVRHLKPGNYVVRATAAGASVAKDFVVAPEGLPHVALRILTRDPTITKGRIVVRGGGSPLASHVRARYGNKVSIAQILPDSSFEATTFARPGDLLELEYSDPVQRVSVAGVAAGSHDARIEIRGGLRTSVECLDTGVARPRRFHLDWREPGTAKYEPVQSGYAFPFDDRGFAHVPLPAGVIDVRFRDPSEPHREVEVLGLHVVEDAPAVRLEFRRAS
jgi:protocatechuate 3,4-dioxygenase beta subunit